MGGSRTTSARGSRAGSSDGAGAGASGADALAHIVDAFDGATKRVEVSSGCVLGCQLTLIDTPGLTASAAGAAANAGVLRGIKRAFKEHAPDLVLYVDR